MLGALCGVLGAASAWWELELSLREATGLAVIAMAFIVSAGAGYGAIRHSRGRSFWTDGPS